jgi:hypothetical protein
MLARNAAVMCTVSALNVLIDAMRSAMNNQCNDSIDSICAAEDCRGCGRNPLV